MGRPVEASRRRMMARSTGSLVAQLYTVPYAFRLRRRNRRVAWVKRKMPKRWKPATPPMPPEVETATVTAAPGVTTAPFVVWTGGLTRTAATASWVAWATGPITWATGLGSEAEAA